MPHSILALELQQLAKKAYSRRKFLKKVILATGTAITSTLVSRGLPQSKPKLKPKQNLPQLNPRPQYPPTVN